MHLRDALRKVFWRFTLLQFLVLLGSPAGFAQAQSSNGTPSQDSALAESIRQLEIQVQELRSAVTEIKSESERYRAETLELKRELQATREAVNAGNRPLNPAESSSARQAAPAAGQAVPDQALAERVAKLEEDQQVVDSRIEEQNQTKIETASKYRMRLSGILLMDLFSNTGNVDHIENPSVALAANPSGIGADTGGSFGATLRQSQIGLEIFGPSFAGAKTRGDIVADFFGEFPETNNGAASGSFRLRTGTIRLDWKDTSLVGGMDNFFVSPGYPTSFASLGIPPFSYSGNLWAWMPQIRVEHRFKTSEASAIILSGGILDPLTGETPPNEFLRLPLAGENSRQPGYGARLEWSRRVFGEALTAGVGGYYNRENWGFNRNVDGWAATTDWSVPFGSRFRLNGKLYAGRAIGGLGAGVGRSVVFSGPLSDPATTVQALRAAGGWAQLTFMPTGKLEFNAAAGQDGAFAADVRVFSSLPPPGPMAPGYFAANLTRNRSEFANVIYRPRSDLLFSTEFRTLRTFAVDGSNQRANQLSLVMGVLF
jgi:hypothetical protein